MSRAKEDGRLLQLRKFHPRRRPTSTDPFKGEEGHSKVDCTKPRVFTGKCRECDQGMLIAWFPIRSLLTPIIEGHEARNCPTKPKICKSCKQEGHEALECKEKMKINMDNVPDKTEDEAWALLTKASDERDLDDAKDAVKMLVKAVPDTDYVSLEKEFRKRDFSVYIIALEKETMPTWTMVDLQGNTGKKYAVGFYLSEKAHRPLLVSKWPASPEDNITRLADAGVPMDRGVDHCTNWLVPSPAPVFVILTGSATSLVIPRSTARRISFLSIKPRSLAPSAVKTVIVCEIALRSVRSLVLPELARFANLRSTLPPTAPIVSSVHAATAAPRITWPKSAPNARTGMSCTLLEYSILTRDSDADDHQWRDCPNPKDWSRVTCRNCGEKGHTIARCKQPKKEEEGARGADASGGFESADAGAGGGSGDWNDAAAPTGGSGQAAWETPAAAVSVGGGGW